ncbi:MAG TPA: glycosyl hydrolase-related protein [Symbiobacteriaceae bacterium]|nr:glycosyl hydrolase-related protein [Symbiobacteriaceae bacterium]
MIETVKQAESDEGVVVRIFEFGNRRGPATLVFGRRIRSAVETNLLEEGATPVSSLGHRLTVDMTPYAIRTLVLRLA